MTILLSLVLLAAAAALEVGGDALIRHGLLGSGVPTMALGAAALVAYGFLVNANRSIDFGRLMGVYIAVFFVVSQIINAVLVRERPEPALLLGGALIVAGGLVIQLGGTR